MTKSGPLEAALARPTPALEPFNASPFARVVQGEPNQPAWVVFSHVDVPQGKFAQSRVFEAFTGTVIYLNAPGNSWYQKGIPGIGDDLEAVHRALFEAITALGPPQLGIVGHSMGAYAALTCADAFPEARILATSAELVLDLPHSRSARNKVAPDPVWRDLYGRAKAGATAESAFLLYGAFDPVDAYFLAEPRTYDGAFGEVWAAPHHHGVTEYLTGRRRYLGMLESLHEDGLDGLASEGLVRDPANLGQREAYAHLYKTYALVQSGERGEELRTALGAFTEWENAGWCYWRARGYDRLGEAGARLDMARRAATAAPEAFEYVMELGEAAKALNHIDDIRKAHELLRAHFAAHPATQAFTAATASILEANPPAPGASRGEDKQRAAATPSPKTSTRPNLLLAGWQKGGAAWLTRALSAHPDIFMPEAPELAHLNKRPKALREGMDAYLEAYQAGKERRYRCDATSSYFWSRLADNSYDNPESLKHRNWTVASQARKRLPKDTKIIVVLRCPVARALAAFYHNFAAGRFRESAQILSAGKRFGVIAMGQARYTLNEWLIHFERDDFHFVRFEDLRDQTHSELRKLAEFLGVSRFPDLAPFAEPSVIPLRSFGDVIGVDPFAGRDAFARNVDADALGALTAPRVFRDEIDALQDMYDDHVAAIEEATGWELDAWRTRDLGALLCL